MKTKITGLFILLLITLLFIACSDDDSDTTAPVINLVSPADGETLIIGNPICFEAVFTDNEELASYKIDIHNNFDDHNHQHSLKSAMDETETFSFNKSWSDIAGKKRVEINHFEIEIPENATPGKYHLMVFCVDASGNESYVARSIVLARKN